MEISIHILDLVVIRFNHDHFICICIFYVGINSQMLSRYWAVKRLMAEQPLTLMFNIYSVHEYILSIFKHQSTNYMSAVHFNLCTE